MKRWLKAMCTCVLLLVCCVHGALAEDVYLSVQRADGVGGEVTMWEKSNGKKYLFLPAYMRDQTLVLTYSGVSSVRLVEMALSSGMAVDAIMDGAQLTLGKDGGTVTVMESANLPAVHITTESGSLDHIHAKKGNKEKGAMQIVTADGVSTDAELDSIKGHGNATFVYEKKSYQIKLEEKAALLGMNEGKSYVLLANQHENSLLRNKLTFELARWIYPIRPNASASICMSMGNTGAAICCATRSAFPRAAWISRRVRTLSSLPTRHISTAAASRSPMARTNMKPVLTRA